VIYSFLANMVIWFHLLFIAFALLGGLCSLWRKWVMLIHIPTAIWISLIEFTGWICPLTPLENYLRAASGAAGYDGGFVEHYLIPIIYPAGLTPDIQILLGIAATLLNISIYAYVIFRSLQEKKT